MKENLPVMWIHFQANPNLMEVNYMGLKHPIGRPVEYSGKVLDQRNDLTGPDAGKATFPELPKNVPIQEEDGKSK
jgi:hypothetical protein